jgi:hypothetical protein
MRFDLDYLVKNIKGNLHTGISVSRAALPNMNVSLARGFASCCRTPPLFGERVPSCILAALVELAARLGNRAWAQILERHNTLIRRELDRYRGREVDTAGDGFFAAFDGTARQSGAPWRRNGRRGRGGWRSGLVPMPVNANWPGEAVWGMAMHVGARVVAHAGAGEMLVTSTVKDLAAGSGLSFQALGSCAQRHPRRLVTLPGKHLTPRLVLPGFGSQLRTPRAVGGNECEVDSGRPVGISAGGFPESPPEPGVPVVPAPGSPLVP